MATYVIGDVQGCYFSLQNLLAKICFDRKRDRLYFLGDVVNRGKHSLQVLRQLYEWQDCADTLLGNHDIHALMLAEGLTHTRPDDTLHALLSDQDSPALLTWLRHRPLMFSVQGYALVHAGVLPCWTIAQAENLAREVEVQLQSSQHIDLLKNLYHNEPYTWQDSLMGSERYRVIVNAMTRLRICQLDGRMEFHFKGKFEKIPDDFYAWFATPERKSQETSILFGHWSALGLRESNNVISLDTGCFWGGKLTAFCLEDKTFSQVACDPNDLVAG